MTLIKQLKQEKNNFFQFYIITGSVDYNFSLVKKFLLENFSEKEVEYYFFENLALKIAESRNIKNINTQKIQKKYRFFLLKAKKFDIESQNALLKTFEEPVQNSVFFLFVPAELKILETIKSRGRILAGEREFFNQANLEKFLAGNFTEREKIILKISENKNKDADWKREQFLNLISDLDLYFSQQSQKNPNILKDFLLLKNDAFERGSNLKNILIYLAIII